MFRRPRVIVSFVLLALATATAAYAQAVRIDSISPTMARPGDQVAITGIGFGGQNVRITVGGFSARIVAGFGNRATFIVPDGVFAGRTVVTATNPGGRAGAIGFQVLLAYTLDDAQAVNGSFGPAGGVLRTQSGGMIFTLTIPRFALDKQQTITLTPVITMSDIPLSHGLIAAARFGPEGLRFRFPARLTIDIPAGMPPGVVLGFHAPDDGTGFHPIPSQTTGTSLEFLVFHFTLIGAGAPVPANIAAQLASLVGSPAEVAVSQMTLLANELAGGTIDQATYEAGLVAAMRRWFYSTVLPKLQAAATDDELFFNSGALEELLAWQGEDEIFFSEGFSPPYTGSLAPEANTAYGLLVAGARNAIAKSNNRCLAQHAVSPYVEREIVIWYMNETGHFDPSDANDFREDTLAKNLCARARVTAIDMQSTIPSDQSTTVTVHAGAFFTDGVPVPAPDNSIEVVFNSTESTHLPLTETLDGPGDIAVSVLPFPDALSVRFRATASWQGSIFVGDDVEVTSCVDPATLTPTGCHWPIAITPATATVQPNHTQRFTATVNGAARSMQWFLLDAVSSGGSLAPTGANTALYTAGNSLPHTFQIEARSVDIPSERQRIAVTIGQGPISITITPQNATLGPGGTLNFSAVVSGGATNAVTWLVTPGGGSIAGTGPRSAVYTAGSTPGVFGITATSLDDPSQSQTVAVVVAASLDFTFDVGFDGWSAGHAGCASPCSNWGSVRWLNCCTDNSKGVDQPGYLQFDGTGDPGHVNSWISKRISLPPGVTTLQFDVGGHDKPDSDARLVVRIVDAAGSTTLLDDRVVGVEFPPDHNYQLTARTLDIARWAGTSVTIFIEQDDNGFVGLFPGRAEQLYLDNIQIR